MDQMRRDASSGTFRAMPALHPEMFFRSWQNGTLRMLKAQECVLSSMALAARAEIRFGQELMAERLNMLNWRNLEPAQASERMTAEVEKLMAVVREVNEELRSGFSDAAKMLSEGASDDMAEAVDKTTAPMEGAAEDAVETGDDTLRKTTRRAKPA